MEEPVFFKKTFNEFLNHLNEHSITTTTKFVVLKTQRNFRVEKVSPSHNQKLFWKDGIPYFYFGSRSYQCHHGKDKNVNTKKKYAEERDKKAAMDHSFKRRHNLMQATKKLDCPASFNVSRVIWIPEFKIPGSQSEHYEKTKVSRVIKDKVGNGESVGEEGYMYNLPNIEEHSNHLIGDSAALTEPLDSRVRDYICQLVRRGERNAVVISKLLETFVESQLHETNRLRRRFFPNLAKVRRIISSEKLKLAKKPNDQENTDILIKSWGGKNGVEEASNTNQLDKSEEFSENEGETTTPEYRELPLRGCSRRHLMNECNSALRSLQSVQWYLNDDDLNTHCINLKNLLQSVCSKVSADERNGLPVETKTDSSLTSQNKKRTKDYGKLSLRLKRGCSGRVGMSADMMKEATKLNIENQTPVEVPVKKVKYHFNSNLQNSNLNKIQ